MAASANGNRSRITKIWSSYIYGQLGNVGRAALWWSSFSVMTITLLSSEVALACSRGAFNCALLIGAPLAVATAEKSPIRTLLIRTTTGRMLLWSFLIPAAWIIFHNWLHLESALWVVVLGIMFLDGIAVAFANAVDIDCGGLELLSLTYSLPITDYVRYRYTALHQEVFDSSFIVLTPPLLLLLAFISSKLPLEAFLPDYIIGDQASTFILVIGIAIYFAVLTFISLYYYRGIPKVSSAAAGTGLYDPLPAAMDERNNRLEDPATMGLPLASGDDDSNRSTRVYGRKFGELFDGWLIVMHDPALKWRLAALATETALEDVMVSVVIPTMALNGTPLLMKSHDVTIAAFVAATIIGIGKLGGFTTSRYLSARWSGGSPQKLCKLVLASSLSLVCLPVGYWLLSQEVIRGFVVPQWLGPGIICLGIGLFFILSTAPKIGFASLIQSAVGNDDTEAATVFGFIGISVTITDGLLIIAMDLLFYYLGSELTELALCLTFLAYVAHGIIECKFAASRLEAPSSQDLFENLAGDGSPETRA